MALKEIAVVGMTFKFVNPAHSGTVTVTGAASTKVKAGGQFVYKTLLAISISNGSDGSTTINATGTGVLIATAIKNKVDGQFVLRKGDQSTVIPMTGDNISPPPPTMAYTTVVEIDDPGQNKVRGE
jgi:hypothetical protein